MRAGTTHRNRLLIGLASAAFIAIPLIPTFAEDPAPATAPAVPAIDVAAAPATEVDWQEKISSIGVAEALQGVDISGSESGNVVEILFDSGSKVKQGQPLVRLDTSKEEADLKANLAQ